MSWLVLEETSWVMEVTQVKELVRVWWNESGFE